MSPAGLPELLTDHQVAEYLDLHVATVRRLAREEAANPGTGIPARKAGQKWKFTAEDIRTFLARTATNPAAAGRRTVGARPASVEGRPASVEGRPARVPRQRRTA